nr:LysM peptidoglycan-binding domain-containing protein [Propionibacterium sp.]
MIMGLFDAIKDAFTTDDGERLEAARKELSRLERELQAAKDRNDINAIADVQGRIEAAQGQIRDYEVKLGQAPAEAAPAEAAAPEPDLAVPAAAEEVPVAVEEVPVAAPADAEPVVAEAPAAPAERTYTVKPGDTLSKIGREFGVTYQSIAELNNIENPDLIYPGQVFRIPNA